MSLMMKPPAQQVAGTEVGYGTAEIASDPPPSTAQFCCPSPLSMALSLICPFSWLGSCRVLNEKEGALLLTWGKFTSVVKTPGIYFLNPCGTSLQKVSTKQQTTDLPNALAKKCETIMEVLHTAAQAPKD